jgi:hypothetical protein
VQKIISGSNQRYYSPSGSEKAIQPWLFRIIAGKCFSNKGGERNTFNQFAPLTSKKMIGIEVKAVDYHMSVKRYIVFCADVAI